MATLQRFKLLATQCTTAGSPSRSPAPSAGGASPAFRLRRRKTLRRLLSRSSGRRLRRDPAVGGDPAGDATAEESSKKGVVMSRTLRDLFVSSPPPTSDGGRGGIGLGLRAEVGPGRRRVGPGASSGAYSPGRLRSSSRPRFGSGGLRYRLLRRTWRPVLVTIPE